MKKATCTTFVNILNTIHKEGITTKVALMADQVLYTNFWFALKDFCHFALLSKTSGKNAGGEKHYSFNDEKQRFAQIRVTPSQLM